MWPFSSSWIMIQADQKRSKQFQYILPPQALSSESSIKIIPKTISCKSLMKIWLFLKSVLTISVYSWHLLSHKDSYLEHCRNQTPLSDQYSPDFCMHQNLQLQVCVHGWRVCILFTQEELHISEIRTLCPPTPTEVLSLNTSNCFTRTNSFGTSTVFCTTPAYEILVSVSSRCDTLLLSLLISPKNIQERWVRESRNLRVLNFISFFHRGSSGLSGEWHGGLA